MNKNFFETIKILDGVVLHLEYHQERLNAALDSSDRYVLHAIVKPLKKGLYKCRIAYDIEDIKIEYLKYTKRKVESLKLVYCDTIIYDKKYSNRDALNALFAKREMCDDILIIKKGLVTDTSIANIAFFDGVTWFTPKTPLLKGTCRARLLDKGQIVEKDIKVKDIKRYKKIALINAMIDFDIIASDKIEEIIC
ncbi:aminotransferase class IV [Sulfurimonas sp. SAG-AH-194-C20]|nr:aminotransferase class IV family protein [Sulfurimonas sp. SAG-AH-194-C20]MDF1878747.1 aminotransferase class IV [Sulfurimonas sp. SAG-AH-194-C20]